MGVVFFTDVQSWTICQKMRGLSHMSSSQFESNIEDLFWKNTAHVFKQGCLALCDAPTKREKWHLILDGIKHPSITLFVSMQCCINVLPLDALASLFPFMFPDVSLISFDVHWGSLMSLDCLSCSLTHFDASWVLKIKMFLGAASCLVSSASWVSWRSWASWIKLSWHFSNLTSHLLLLYLITMLCC